MENLIKELFIYLINLMPDLFNLDSVSYWQSFIMLVLTGTLFKTGRVAISRIEEQ